MNLIDFFHLVLEVRKRLQCKKIFIILMMIISANTYVNNKLDLIIGGGVALLDGSSVVVGGA